MTADEFEVSVRGGGVSISRKVTTEKAHTIIGIILSGGEPTQLSHTILAAPPARMNAQGEEKRPTAPRGEVMVSDLANLLKEHKLFERFQEKVLLTRNFWNKIAGILVLLDRPLLPGEVAGVLAELGSKGAANNVSKYLGTRKALLITSGPKGGRRYKLTTKAKLEFEKVLNAQGK